MDAFRLLAPHRAQLCSLPKPEPGPGDVLVRVGAAGACHSDLHVLDADDALGMPVPVTLGHEIAGWIAAVGPGVDPGLRGEAIAVYGIVGCGTCVSCLAGRDNECRRTAPGGIGLSRDGGMAEYVVVPARQIVPIGDLDVVQAAPLTDAGLTPYHAIAGVRSFLRPTSTCTVIGVGGLGHLAIQILLASAPSRLIAVDTRERALALARQLGVADAVAFGPDAATRIRERVGPAPDGVDVVLDFVGSTETLQLARSIVATGGCISIVGLAGGTLGVAFGALPFEVRVTMPFWGTRAELCEVIALARAGKIRAHVNRFPLRDASLAYERLRAGDLDGRAVVIPGSVGSHEDQVVAVR